MLFTSGDGLDSRTAAELKRMFGTVANGGSPAVTLVGDDSVLSASVESAVQALGYRTQRVGTTATQPNPYAEPPTGYGFNQLDPQQVVVLADGTSPQQLGIAEAYAAAESYANTGWDNVVILPTQAGGALTLAEQQYLAAIAGGVRTVVLAGPSTEFSTATLAVIQSVLAPSTALVPTSLPTPPTD